MSWKAVLFDMDGVLIDSEEYMAKTGVRALKKYGIEAKESDFAEFVGCGENRYVGGVAEKYGVPYRTEMKDYLYACYGEHVKEEANIPDGVLDVLHTLRSRGYKLAVCSSADRVNYSVKKHEVTLTDKEICLTLAIDTEVCAVIEYFEIFMDRMLLCRRAVEKLGLHFALVINGQRMA